MSRTPSIKWIGRFYQNGGSLCLLIPKTLAEQLGVKRGDYMAMVPVGECILTRRITEKTVLDRDSPAEAVDLLDALKELRDA